MKKVLIISLARNGAGVYYPNSIIDEFREIDYAVLVSKYTKEGFPKKNYTPITTFRTDTEFALYTLFILPFILIKTGFRLWKERFEVLYFPYSHHWNLFFILLGKLLRKKTLLTVHDGVLHTGENRWIEQFLTNLTIKNADELLFLTAFVRDTTQKKIGFSGKSHIVAHGILEPPFRTPIFDRHLPEKPKLLMIGRMNRYKGIEILLKAITEIEVNLYKKITFAGKINYDLEKYLSPQIEWIDKWLSPQEIADLLTEHDIMIIPYPEATQSGVLTLAIAAEMPIVCTNVGGLAEQVTSEEAIIVLPDSTSLKTGIQALLIDADLYRNLHLRLKIKRANASWQHIATKIELIISQMLDNETAK